MMSSIRCNHAHRSDYKLGDLTVQENTSAAACSCRLEIKIPRVGLLLPNPSHFVGSHRSHKLQHLGKQVFKKNAIKTEIWIPRTGTPQRHQQTGDLGRLRGRIWHAKTGVKSYETSGFYISIHPT